MLRMAGRLKFLAELRLVINQTLRERAALTLLKSRMSRKRKGLVVLSTGHIISYRQAGLVKVMVVYEMLALTAPARTGHSLTI